MSIVLWVFWVLCEVFHDLLFQYPFIESLFSWALFIYFFVDHVKCAISQQSDCLDFINFGIQELLKSVVCSDSWTIRNLDTQTVLFSYVRRQCPAALASVFFNHEFIKAIVLYTKYQEISTCALRQVRAKVTTEKSQDIRHGVQFLLFISLKIWELAASF